MKKISALLALMLFLLFCFCAANALAADPRVFDQGRLFSAAEKDELEQAIARFQQDTGMDFVVLTSVAAHGDTSSEAIADDFYDSHGFGLDEESSGTLYFIDLYERVQHLSTSGQMIDYLTDERIQSAIDACTSFLGSGRYAAGANAMLARVEEYVKRGIPENQYRYDILTGRPLTRRHHLLTLPEVLLSAAIALAGGFFFTLLVKRRYRLKGSTYRYDLRHNAQLQMTGADDTFLRSATTRTPKPRPPDGGGGGGGGSGGSGVHIGSSGASHGGGGGHF